MEGIAREIGGKRWCQETIVLTVPSCTESVQQMVTAVVLVLLGARSEIR
jgi:hypothetical protein